MSEDIIASIERRGNAKFLVKDIIRLNGSFMLRAASDSAELTKLIKDQLDYLGALGQDVGNMYYLENFCHIADKSQPIIDKVAINKIIGRYMEDVAEYRAKESEPERNKQYELMQTQKVGKAVYTQKLGVVTRDLDTLWTKVCEFQDNIRRHERDIVNYTDRLADSLHEFREAEESAIKLEEAIENFEDGEVTPLELEIKKIVDDGQWVLYEVGSEDSLYYKFYSKESVVVSEINTAMNINRSVDVGHFSLIITPFAKYSKFKVGRFFNNRTKNTGRGYRNTIHPHLTMDSICWGSSRHLYGQYLKEGEWFKLIKLLDGLLKEFWPDNPYCTLNSMKRTKVDPQHSVHFRRADRDIHEKFLGVDTEELYEVFPNYKPEEVIEPSNIVTGDNDDWID